jgi:hypothetical protein
MKSLAINTNSSTPRRCMGEWRYSSTIFYLGPRQRCQLHGPAAFSRRKSKYPLDRRLSGFLAIPGNRTSAIHPAYSPMNYPRVVVVVVVAITASSVRNWMSWILFKCSIQPSDRPPAILTFLWCSSVPPKQNSGTVPRLDHDLRLPYPYQFNSHFTIRLHMV